MGYPGPRDRGGQKSIAHPSQRCDFEKAKNWGARLRPKNGTRKRSKGGSMEGGEPSQGKGKKEEKRTPPGPPTIRLVNYRSEGQLRNMQQKKEGGRPRVKRRGDFSQCRHIKVYRVLGRRTRRTRSLQKLGLGKAGHADRLGPHLQLLAVVEGRKFGETGEVRTLKKKKQRFPRRNGVYTRYVETN